MKRSFNLATYPPRLGRLQDVINSIYNQADIIRVYLNEYTLIPDFLIDDKIEVAFGLPNIKDTGKFYWADTFRNEYYFTIDDDIIYPKNYADTLIDCLERNNVSVATMHGRVMRKDSKHPANAKKYPFFQDLKEDKYVNYIGTGVSVFDLRKIVITKDVFKLHGFTDEQLAGALKQMKVPIVCSKHKAMNNYIKYPETLWGKLGENEKTINDILGIDWTSKNKISVGIPFWRRPEITECEGNKSRKLAEKYGFEYHEVENNVTKKYNKCFSEAKKHNVDACIKVDSDSIISSKFFQYWNKCINSGVDYSEVLDIWFVFQDSYCLWGGYKNHRKGEGTGVGRFLSKKLLNILNWQPMGKDSYVSNDLEMTKVIRGINGITTEAVTCDIGDIIDIKGHEQITDLSKAEYSVIEGIEKAPIDITPIKQYLLVSGLKKKKYSIVIPAYNCVDYIEQCLDSIEKQTYFKKNNEFEVLVGVDGCQKTLSKILKIKHKYRNLRVFEFGTNKGCYVTLNSLILASNYDNICIFGADDWAYDTAISEYSKRNEMLIRNKFTWVQNEKIGKTSDFYAYGAICMQRILFDLVV